MNIRYSMIASLSAATAGALLMSAAGAATFTLYNNRANFLTALGGAPTSEQDFEGFANGTNMSGVAFLPGMSATTNLSSISIFTTGGNHVLFISPRDQSTATYDVQSSGGYNAVGFDIVGFNPATPGPGLMDILFADGSTSLGNKIFPTNPTENDPLFFGVVANSAVTDVRWSEGPETDGRTCCEETALDKFVVASVPLPGALPLLSSGLITWFGFSRRKGVEQSN